MVTPGNYTFGDFAKVGVPFSLIVLVVSYVVPDSDVLLGFGMNGPDRDAGAYDATAFWARGGSADGLNPPDAEQSAFMPAGAYGDNIGGMTIAGGVAAALYGRHVTGEPSVLDVSLLAVGAWTTQFSVNMAMLMGGPLPKVERRTQAPGNPLTGAYRTSDGRFVQLSMLQPTRYWPEFCRLMGLDEYAEDPRFESLASMAEHADLAYGLVHDAIGKLTFAECKDAAGQGHRPVGTGAGCLGAGP